MKLPLNAASQREYYPLTFNQQGIWLLNQTSPGDPVLDIGSRVRLKGTLQVEKLVEALTLLIESNSTLRTRFIIINNEPYQVITPDIKPALTYIDLSDRLKFEREVEARVLSEREARQPFDLFKGPLVRFMLTRLEEDDHLFLFNIHHIISDATSLNLIWEKLISLYNELVKTGTGNLTHMKVHYHDFALWQHQAFNHDYFKHQEHFWLKEFPGKVPQVTGFPTDLKTRSALNYNGSICETVLDREFADSLKKFSFRHKVNLFSTLLAAFHILLHKFTGQEDQVIGVYFSARQNHPGLFFSIGWLINVLPLRVHIFSGQTVLSFLKSLKDKVSQVYLNQDYPLIKLIRKINPQRFSNRLPLFQVVFNMVPANLPNTPMEGLSAGDREIIDTRTSQYDLTVLLYDRPSGLRIKFEYSTNLYKRDSIIKLMDYYQIILKKMLTDPGVMIGKLDILSQEEKQKLEAWLNQTDVEYDKSKCIHTLFEEQSERTPDSLALVFEHRHLTYHELNRRADRLAGILQAKGVKPSMVVGAALQRSAELMAGIFGILKAGGIYLPLDPDYPAQRIDYMVKDSGIRVMLTQIPGDRDGIDITDPRLYDGNVSGNLPAARHNDPAYVIYTSGSTGSPKGVIIEHGSLLNRLNWMQRAYPVKTGDMLIQKTPLVFDVSIWELFWWSVNGASLCLMKPGEEKDAQAILETIEKNQVTVIHFVPSMLNIFLQYLERSNETVKKLSSLQKVFASGEALKPAQVEKFYKLVGKEKNAPRLINLYGPTEATVDVTYYNCPPNQHLSVIPIGKPIDNIRLYVVNRDLGLNPLGAAGELCIAGRGLARGYLNNPELTDEKFVFYRSYRSYMTYISKALYKTGDLARWLPDGNVEFLGRIDNQVKIRGFRIELEEIEKNLLDGSLVKEAAVGLEEDMQVGPRLTAYLVLKPGKTPTKNELIDRLKTRLPEYMIPTDFVILDRLCYTGSGKLDRKALSAQQNKKLETQDNFTPPSSAIEEGLVKIWAEALGVEKVGTRDNFFYLGGHSLLASKIILQVREIFGVDISLLTLFSTPTVEGMSQKINRLLDKN
jgi:amino acid adenylation domain-containing protein